MKVQQLQQHKVEKFAADIAGFVSRLEAMQGERVALWDSIGSTLIKLKHEISHGKWVDYISGNIPLDMRQCQKYMHFHREYGDDILGAERFTSLDDALGYADKRNAEAQTLKDNLKAKAKDDKAKAVVVKLQAKEKKEIIATKGEAYWEQLQEQRYQEGDRKDHPRANREFINDWRISGNHVIPPNKVEETEKALALLQMYPPNPEIVQVVYDYLKAKHNPAKFKADSAELDDATDWVRDLDWALRVLTK